MSELVLIMRTKLAYWRQMLSVLVAISCGGQVLAADDATPKIVDCRIGFDGMFKVGHWTPVSVSISGEPSAALRVAVTAADSDGVDMTVSAPLLLDQHPNGLLGSAVAYTKVGRLGGNVRVKLIDEDGRVLDRVELSTVRGGFRGSKFIPLPATGKLLLQLGGGSLGVVEAIAQQESADGSLLHGAVQLPRLAELPSDWFGYEAADIVVLATADQNFCVQLVADQARFEALRKWLELGGRLVVASGRTAPELLAVEKPLAELLPGTFEELVRLPQTQSIESFAGSVEPIGQRGVPQNLAVPRLVDVRGRVEVYGRGSDLPLVVRTARGLGELVFVGIDFTEPPLAEWTGKRAFWNTVIRPYGTATDFKDRQQKLVSLGYDDLSGALRQRLGRSFRNVQVIGFSIVAGLILGYLLLLGPLDYLFVEKVTRRSGFAWITLPLILLAVSASAAALAGAAKKTAGPQLNRAELVDFDLATQRVRGLCWSTIYSPDARLFDVSVLPQLPDGKAVVNAQLLVSWLGLPGSGLGGMHAAGSPIDVAGVGYQAVDRLRSLVGLPVLTAASKSLQAQWDSKTLADQPPIAAKLAVDDDGLLVGTLSNETNSTLTNLYLLYGQWGYRLGELRAGRRIEIGPQLSAIRVKTIVTRRVRPGSTADQGVFFADRATVDELLNLMMFFEAAGGEAFAGLPNRYQANCDLSRLLELDRAILVARGTHSGSDWIDSTTNEPLATEQAASTAVYRYILPIEKNTSDP